MKGHVLKDGQYLGQTVRALRTDTLLVSDTLHEKSVSEFHAHANAYLSILLSGLYVEVSKDKPEKITPSHAIFRPSQYQHKNQFISDQTKCLNIEFSPEWFYQQEISDETCVRRITETPNHPWLLQLLIDFLKYDSIDFFEDELIDLVIGRENPKFALRQPWLERLVKILDNEIGEVHSLQTLSERVFVHPNYMSRVFKEHFGITIGQYQIRKKLQYGTKKLFAEKDTIASIASDCGFFDEPHFIRTFKTCNGITPHQFRILLNS